MSLIKETINHDAESTSELFDMKAAYIYKYNSGNVIQKQVILWLEVHIVKTALEKPTRVT